MKQTRKARRRRRKMKKLALLIGLLLGVLLIAVIAIKGICFVIKSITADKKQEQVSVVSIVDEVPSADTQNVQSQVVQPQSEQEQSVQPQPELSQEEKMAVIQSGDAYPQELKDLANRNSETIDFVYNYPQLKDQVWTGDLSAESQSGGVPLLLQWDERWGYAEYNGGMLGYTGCGPTCITMVALYLTNDPTVNPISVGAFSESAGHCKVGSGSNWSLISKGCEQYGMRAEVVSVTEKRMKAKLDAGCPIIANVGPGDFTTGGHYLVIVGYDNDGFIINDPNSFINSSKRWTFERLSGQIKNLWAMSKI